MQRRIATRIDPVATELIKRHEQPIDLPGSQAIALERKLRDLNTS
jgi:hypothetical protein